MQRRLIDTFKAARRCSTPLIGITTQDQPAVIASIRDNVNGETPMIRWDGVEGFTPVNEDGENTINSTYKEDMLEEARNPVTALSLAKQLPAGSILFFVNAHRFVTADTGGPEFVCTGVGNLREIFKRNKRMLVLLGPQFSLPLELQNDVIMLDDPSPDDSELGNIMASIYDAAKSATDELPDLDDETKRKGIGSLRGLPAFTAEQIVAMSLQETGLDLDDCWARKRSAVNSTKGLSMLNNDDIESLDDLGGLETATDFVKRRAKGNAPIELIVFVDEIEKSMAGAQSDTSGVSQDLHGVMLREMQDNKWSGILCVGPPGSGKSAFAKATGKTLGIPTIVFDSGGFKGSLVGQSEQAVRNAFKVIKGMGGKRVLFIATCNKMDVLSPELRRRFKQGTYFFDLPDENEKAVIWDIHLARYGLNEDGIKIERIDRPEDANWTGAEIANCCELAWQLEISLKDAAQYVVPVAVADPESIERLRKAATGRWLSASYAGPYIKKNLSTKSLPKKVRDISMN